MLFSQPSAASQLPPQAQLFLQSQVRKGAGEGNQGEKEGKKQEGGQEGRNQGRRVKKERELVLRWKERWNGQLLGKGGERKGKRH